MSKLIIIRGNSGSGKTTVAKKLQEYLQPHFANSPNCGTMLIPQDTVRRDITRTRDTLHNPSIQLIKDIALYGRHIGYDVIIEGILPSDIYGDMLRELANQFEETHTYYLGISFEETLRRHETKPNAHEFGEGQMREWYREKDILALPDEILFNDDDSEDEIFQTILRDL